MSEEDALFIRGAIAELQRVAEGIAKIPEYYATPLRRGGVHLAEARAHAIESMHRLQSFLVVMAAPEVFGKREADEETFSGKGTAGVIEP
jgi:hypothetical protein